MSTSKRAAIYCRVSSEGQEDNASLPTQEAGCRAYAEYHGYEVVGVYSDIHTGFELWERQQLALLRNSIKRSEVDAVICYALDRLSRKQAHIAIVADECDRAGVALLFVTEEFERSAVGEFIRSAKAFAAEVEREKIRERTQRGKQARLASGKLNAGKKAPFGYRFRDASKGALDIDEDEASIVRQIFSEVAAGVSMHKIADRFNGSGVPTPTGEGRWHHATLRKLLSRDAYIGIARANVEIATRVNGKRVLIPRPESEHVILPEGTIPPIVTKEVFAQAQRRLARNKAEAIRNHREPEAFLLRAGYIHCGYCGRALIAQRSRSDSRGKPYRRRYRGDTGHDETCRLVWIDAETIDRAVGLRLSQLLQNPGDTIGRFAAQASSSADELKTVERLIGEVDRKSRKLAARIAATEDDDVADVLMPQLHTLQERKRALETERATIAERHDEAQRREHLLRAMMAWIDEIEIDPGDLVGSHLRTRERVLVAKALLDFDHTYPGIVTESVYNTRRRLLDLFGIDVKIYSAKEKPRWVITAAIDLPLAEPTQPHIVEPKSCGRPRR